MKGEWLPFLGYSPVNTTHRAVDGRVVSPALFKSGPRTCNERRPSSKRSRGGESGFKPH